MSTVPPRCVCTAALARARELYDDLEGTLVWMTCAEDTGSSRLGVLHVLTDRPGYVHLDRGDAEKSQTRHIDDIWSVITDEEERAARQA